MVDCVYAEFTIFFCNHLTFATEYLDMLVQCYGISHPSTSHFIQRLDDSFWTDRSKAVLLLWFLTVNCSCCPYLYFGSAIMLVTYFVNFR